MRASEQLGLPNSWYQLDWVHRLKRNKIHHAVLADQPIVYFRDDQGEVRAFRAFCPHLGTNLKNGRLLQGGKAIQCPFHGWQFDKEGTCLKVAYAKGPTPKVSLSSYSVKVLMGIVYIYIHSEHKAPSLRPEAIPDFIPSHFVMARSSTHLVRTHIQEMVENIMDKSHFFYVHDTGTIPEMTFNFDQNILHVIQKTIRRQFGKERSLLIDTKIYEPGLTITKFRFLTDFIMVGAPVPVSHNRVKQFLSIFVPKNNYFARYVLSPLLLKIITREFQKDVRIWESKNYLSEPRCCSEDGPILEFRKWFAQFY